MDWSLSYSTDGSSFTSFSNYQVNVVSWSGTPASGSSFAYDLTSVSSIVNVPTVYFRLVATSAATNTAGTVRIDNFTVSGTATGAATLYWDADGGPDVGGTGIWDTTAQNWNPLADGSGTPTNYSSTSTAVFGGIGGTVTLGAGGVTAEKGLIFDGGAYVVRSNVPADKLTLTTVNTITSNTAAEISAGIEGGIGLNKMGPGTLTLSGTNGFVGNVSIGEGTLGVTSDAALGITSNDVQLSGGALRAVGSVTLDAARDVTGSGGIDVSNGASLEITGLANFTTLAVTGNGAFTMSGALRSVVGLNLAGPATIFGTAGPITLGNGNLSSTHTSGTATIAADLSYGGLNATRTITVADGSAATDLLISGKLLSTGTAGRLHKLGDGTLRLEGDNSGFVGGLRIGTTDDLTPVNGGTLEVTTNKALGTQDLQFNAGTLKLSGNFTGPNAFPATVNLSIGSSTMLPARFAGDGGEFAGGISLFKPFGALETYRHQINVETSTAVLIHGSFGPSTGEGVTSGLNFGGTGNIIFTNPNNTVAEDFYIDGPTVGLIFAFASVDVEVLSGELDFFQTQLKDVKIGDGLGDDAALGAVGLGASGATFNSLSLLSDATFTLLLNTGQVPNPTADRVSVNTTVNLGAGVASLAIGDVNSVLLPLGTQFTLIDGMGSAPVGFFDGYPEGRIFELEENFFQISYLGGVDGRDVTLTTVVPEPGVGTMALVGIVSALGLRRRRATR